MAKSAAERQKDRRARVARRLESVIHALRHRVLWYDDWRDKGGDGSPQDRLFAAQSCLTDAQKALGLPLDEFDETGRPVGYSYLDYMRFHGVDPADDAWAKPTIREAK